MQLIFPQAVSNHLLVKNQQQGRGLTPAFFVSQFLNRRTRTGPDIYPDCSGSFEHPSQLSNRNAAGDLFSRQGPTDGKAAGNVLLALASVIDL